MDKFFEDLECIENTDEIPIAKMIITPEQEFEFLESTACYMCGQRYTDDDVPVRNHEHLSGLYRGSDYNKCNLKHRQTKRIKVIVHNLRGYDSNLILKAYNGYVDEMRATKGSIGVIANTDEKYMRF